VARLGVRDYVTKPFSEELFLAKVLRAISLKRDPLTTSGKESQPRSRNVETAQGPQTLKILRQNLQSHPPRHRQPPCSGLGAGGG